MSEKDNSRALTTLHIETINNLLSDMQYGSITIIIQDGKIIQIDKTEKHRLKN